MTPEMVKSAMDLFKSDKRSNGPNIVFVLEKHLNKKYNFYPEKLKRYLRVAFYEGFRLVLEVGDEVSLSVEEPEPAKPTITGVAHDFSYKERLVLLTYIQFHFKFITQE